MDRGEERGHYNKWLWLVSTLPSRFFDPTAYATLPKRKLIFYFYNSAVYNSALPFRFSFAQLHAGPLPIFVKKEERKKNALQWVHAEMADRQNEYHIRRLPNTGDQIMPCMAKRCAYVLHLRSLSDHSSTTSYCLALRSESPLNRLGLNIPCRKGSDEFNLIARTE